jgi:hypothetical protein
VAFGVGNGLDVSKFGAGVVGPVGLLLDPLRDEEGLGFRAVGRGLGVPLELEGEVGLVGEGLVVWDKFAGEEVSPAFFLLIIL